MRFHDPERIQGYCRTCEKYGRFWSCPPFEEQPLAQLPAWSHALLVTRKTGIPAGSTPEDLMDRFLDERLVFGKWLRRYEHDGVLSLVAGHCFGCASCTRPSGRACALPESMRYSLEALGFDVTGLAEGLAGQTIDWVPGGVPETLMTVGAVLCPDHGLAQRLFSDMCAESVAGNGAAADVRRVAP